MKDKLEQLSQLVDGELTTEATNELLRDLLTDVELRESLDEQLRLRTLLAPWREQMPKDTAFQNAIPHGARPHFSSTRRYCELAAAAILAGLLVFSGFWLSERQHQGREVAASNTSPERSLLPLRQPWIITAEKQKEVADIFSFYESVTGPLTWLADSESKIAVNEATNDSEFSGSPRPIAFLIRLKDIPDKPSKEQGHFEHEYIVVCRSGSAATINLPDGGTPLRIRMLAECGPDDKVQLKYALAAVSKDQIPSVLSGERSLGLCSSSLGQLVMEHQLVSVEAGAWLLGETSL